MTDQLNNLFVRPCYDFFGPEGTEENLSCAMTLEPAMDHLVADCNFGIARVKVIHFMCKQIIESDICPTWLRYNGSVDLTELRKRIKMSDQVAEKLLTPEGYVKLSDLHQFDRASLNQWSATCQSNQRWNPCPLGASEVDHRINQVAFSPAIALRIKMGKDFNPHACPEAFKQLPTVTNLAIRETLKVEKPAEIQLIEKASYTDTWLLKRALTVGAVALLVLGFFYLRGAVKAPSLMTSSLIPLSVLHSKAHFGV